MPESISRRDGSQLEFHDDPVSALDRAAASKVKADVADRHPH